MTNFYPTTNFTFHFAGLELSTERNGKTHIVNEKLKGSFYRGSVADFLLDFGIDNLPKDNTIFIGYNPGFGSGYDLLLHSWCVDLVTLINANYPIVFTQANDYSDMRGEVRVLETIFENKVNFVIEPQQNPFRAVTHYHEEGKKETSWSCSSTHLYCIKGWKET